MQNQKHQPRVAEMRAELEFLTREEIPDWIATTPPDELTYAMQALALRIAPLNEALGRMDATEREVIDPHSGVMTFVYDEAAVADARREHRLLLVRERRNRRLSVERRRCAALPSARTAPRPRGAGRPRAAASRSSARSGDSGEDGAPASPASADRSSALAPRPSSITDRQARMQIAANLAASFDSTASLARYLVRRLGWSWDHAYSAVGDAELFGPIDADGQGRIIRPARGDVA